MAHTHERETTAGFSSIQGKQSSLSPTLVSTPIPALSIAFHPDWSRIGESFLMSGLLAGRKVQLSRVGPAFGVPGGEAGSPIADPFISRAPLVFEAGPEDAVVLDIGQSRTHVRVVGQADAGRYAFSNEQMARGAVILLANRVALLLYHHIPSERPRPPRFGMVGASMGLERVRAAIERVADLDFPVLIRGESGTGKEMVASAIHRESNRCRRPMVSVNMASIPTSLASSELFGAIRGAYSGSVQNRDGYFRRAHGGVLFLDEIGETPGEIQAMLLRALETGEIYPVGGQSAIRVDVRVLAATDANLEDMTATGGFKSPLLHRLSSYEIRIPPLRERREDIGPLLRHFFQMELKRVKEMEKCGFTSAKQDPWPPADQIARLIAYHWPGNVRELHNTVRQIVIDNRGSAPFILDQKIESALNTSRPSSRGEEPETPEPTTTVAKRRRPRDITEEELRAALKDNHWDLKPTAQQLHISRPSLYKLMKKFEHIRTAGELTLEEITAGFRECEGDTTQMAARLEVSEHALRRRVRELGLM